MYERKRAAYMRRGHGGAGHLHSPVTASRLGAHNIGARCGDGPQRGKKPLVGGFYDTGIAVDEVAFFKQMVGFDVDDVDEVPGLCRIAHLLQQRVGRSQPALIARSKNEQFVFFNG